jgi:hypothetical protein
VAKASSKQHIPEFNPIYPATRAFTVNYYGQAPQAERATRARKSNTLDGRLRRILADLERKEGPFRDDLKPNEVEKKIKTPYNKKHGGPPPSRRTITRAYLSHLASRRTSTNR